MGCWRGGVPCSSVVGVQWRGVLLIGPVWFSRAGSRLGVHFFGSVVCMQSMVEVWFVGFAAVEEGVEVVLAGLGGWLALAGFRVFCWVCSQGDGFSCSNGCWVCKVSCWAFTRATRRSVSPRRGTGVLAEIVALSV